MEDILLVIFGSNAKILQFFGKDTLEECRVLLNEKYEGWERFVNIHLYNLENGCTCESINQICNTCYKISVYQDYCWYTNTKAENLTNDMRNMYNEIVTECNRREINMNSFLHW